MRAAGAVESFGDGPWTPLCEHVAFRQGPEQPRGEPHHCRPDADYQVLIATVPDPEQTHLALDFDRYVEGIAWAVADSDFSLENHWFPWQPITSKQETDPKTREEARRDRQKRLKSPGILLFRKRTVLTPKEQLLVVFLVGERPTNGIDRASFETALEMALQLSPRLKRFRVVGPSFSGSLPTLRLFLNDQKLWKGRLQHKRTPFTFISGQTTNTRELKSFGPDKPDTLCTTVHDDYYAIRNFLSYLPISENENGPDVALLSEDETAYGSDIGGPGQEFTHPVLMIRYPRGIATLRNTTSEIPSAGTETARTAGEAVPELPLILKDTGEDLIRTFSRQQTPVSNEAVLVNIAGLLRRNRIRYVGVLATDPLDALFLVRFLRASCPDTQLVIFSSDLLFARVAHNWSIEGLLSVTTYPLFMENQDYMEPRKPPRRITFPSAYAEGVYNATRGVLNLEQGSSSEGGHCEIYPGPDSRNSGMLEYSSPFARETRRQHTTTNSAGSELAASRPPLWLTMLGHDSFWPLALIDGPVDQSPSSTLLLNWQRKDRGKETCTRDLPEKPSFLWRAIVYGFTTSSFVVLLAIPIMNCKPLTWLEKRLRPSPTARTFCFGSDGQHRTAKAVNLFIILMTIGIVNALLAATFSSLEGHIGAIVFWKAAVVAALAEGIWMTILVFQHQEKWKAVWDAVLLLIFSWAFAICCFAEISSTINDSPALYKSYFFAYRALHPESGVSPILPPLILAVGYFYWAWIQLRRLRWAGERRPWTPGDPCQDAQQSSHKTRTEIEKAATEIALVEPPSSLKDEIQRTFGDRTAIAALPLIAIWWWFFWQPGTAASIEPSSYRWFFGLLLAIMYGMLIGNWIRFLILWKDLSRMLNLLENHPLRGAFSRLPNDFSWTSIWIGSLMPQMSTLSRSYECLRALLSRGVHLLASGQAESLGANLQTVIYGPDRFSAKYFKAFEEIECSYGAGAMNAAEALKMDWRHGHSETLSEHDKEESSAPLSPQVQLRWLLEEFVALRYVAYIRYVLQQMRNFLEFVTTGFMLLAVATVAYPFQGHRSISAAHWILFVLLGTGVVLVFLRMDRDPLLSRLNNSQPNKIGSDFLWRILSYGFVPLVSLLGSQFPSIREFLFSWVQPALQAIK